MLRIAAAALALAAAGSTIALEAQSPRRAAASRIDPALAAAVADPRRAEDRARDRWRRPAETLAFFQVGPAMKVGEYAPGGGWYSRLLGLYLGPRGKLVGLYYDPAANVFDDKRKQGIREAAAKYPADVAGWSGQPAERFAGYTLGAIPEGEKGTFDRILVMRSIHNMHRTGIADSELASMRALLNEGGLLGVEQHRARPGTPYAYADGNKGYMLESDVIKLIEAQGFSFAGKSELNANPRDPASWPDGVWVLPPAFQKKDVDRARYEAVGESDRMTLLFRKRA
jgi:predicted methyltransferase